MRNIFALFVLSLVLSATCYSSDYSNGQTECPFYRLSHESKVKIAPRQHSNLVSRHATTASIFLSLLNFQGYSKQLINELINPTDISLKLNLESSEYVGFEFQQNDHAKFGLKRAIDYMNSNPIYCISSNVSSKQKLSLLELYPQLKMDLDEVVRKLYSLNVLENDIMAKSDIKKHFSLLIQCMKISSKEFSIANAFNVLEHDVYKFIDDYLPVYQGSRSSRVPTSEFNRLYAATFRPLCEHRKITKFHQHEKIVYSSSNEGKKYFANVILEELKRNRPVMVGLCNARLKNSGPSLCGATSAVIVGMKKIGNGCFYVVKNNQPCVNKKSSPVKCEADSKGQLTENDLIHAGELLRETSFLAYYNKNYQTN